MNISWDIDCPAPNCTRTINVTLREVEQGGTKRCGNGHAIKLNDEGGGARRAREAEDDFNKALDDLDGTFGG